MNSKKIKFIRQEKCNYNFSQAIFFTISLNQKPNESCSGALSFAASGSPEVVFSEKSGISKCIELDDLSAAFSGTIDNYDLYISLDIIKKRGKDYIYAYMGDHFEWYEWEIDSLNEFEDKIAEYFCENINRTIKTITETKRHKYIRVTEYYLNKETNEWILMSDDKISCLIIRPFIEADDITEEIKEYHI